MLNLVRAMPATPGPASGLPNQLARKFALLVLSFSMCSVAFAADALTNEARVVEAMRTMYVAATNDDLAKFRTVAATDFYAFDLGKRFSGDELMSFIKGAHATGKVYVWQVTEPQVQVDGNTAWITYINRGSVQDAAGKKEVSWLESAVLRKENGEWRIKLFHSTRVPSG